ncbi:hypothetical protein TPL01_30820 [Sulfuriferula plumbiphila]|uniref:Uncharacterized protein n=1 Tax=Sulfuriferula plumbiphila TaxID=171865 RepID=A0A512LBT1_9PROT|nr:hypothetical protein [Sulfuriferula plumbiphila]BBP04141.1 hypothetical protein SFPGR_15630 [Sulfuriferula plumbiphila]GEP31944.1 hypothetical protein TPL01_30820 [Sulfuriferula plumbiphila]
MYIVLFAFAYIWIMMLVTATSLFKAIAVFVIGGSLIALVYYILDTPGRKRRKPAEED